jgi:hypothetical protein
LVEALGRDGQAGGFGEGNHDLAAHDLSLPVGIRVASSDRQLHRHRNPGILLTRFPRLANFDSLTKICSLISSRHGYSPWSKSLVGDKDNRTCMPANRGSTIFRDNGRHGFSRRSTADFAVPWAKILQRREISLIDRDASRQANARPSLGAGRNFA